MKPCITRRELLRYLGVGSAGLALAACQPKIVEVEKQVTTVVEVEKVVEQTVVVEKEVEVIKEPTAVPAPTGPTTLTFWFTAENHKPEYESRIPEFNEKFNIDLKWELLSRDAQTKKFPATLMAGSGFPDVIEMNAGDIIKFLKGDDNIIPFTALNEVLATSPYYEQVLESRWDRFTKGGNRYACPHDVHPIVMLYNSAEWAKIGIDPSTLVTWDEYLEACAKVPSTMPDGRPRYAVMDALTGGNLLARMLEKGIWWTDQQEEPTLTTSEFKEAVENWMKFKPYFLLRDDSIQIAAMKEGQVMTMMTPDWQFGIHVQGTLEDAEFLANSPMRIARIPDFVPDGPHTGSWGGTGCLVPKVAPNQQLSIEVMLYMYFENGNGQMAKRFKDTGIIPPVKTSWGDPGFHEEMPYLGGQKGAEVFIAAAEDLPGYSENWKTGLISESWNEQFPLLWDGQISIDEAIEAADASARDKIAKNE